MDRYVIAWTLNPRSRVRLPDPSPPSFAAGYCRRTPRHRIERELTSGPRAKGGEVSPPEGDAMNFRSPTRNRQPAPPSLRQASLPKQHAPRFPVEPMAGTRFSFPSQYAQNAECGAEYLYTPQCSPEVADAPDVAKGSSLTVGGLIRLPSWADSSFWISSCPGLSLRRSSRSGPSSRMSFRSGSSFRIPFCSHFSSRMPSLYPGRSHLIDLTHLQGERRAPLPGSGNRNPGGRPPLRYEYMGRKVPGMKNALISPTFLTRRIGGGANAP